MQIFYWLILLMIAFIALFAVQNSTAPPMTLKFFIWKTETSLVYVVLGSMAAGILMTLFLWVPRAVRTSLRRRRLKGDLEAMEIDRKRQAVPGQNNR